MSASAIEQQAATHDLHPWTVSDQGTAVGPSVAIGTGDDTVIVTAVWSDVDGVGVTIEGTDDLIPAPAALAIAVAVQQLATTPPPAQESATVIRHPAASRSV